MKYGKSYALAQYVGKVFHAFPFKRKEREFLSSYIGRNRKVLDFGCGLGWLTAELQARHPTCTFFATDVNDYALGWGRRHHPRIRFIEMDRLHEWEGTFDVVLCSHVLEHIEKPAGAVKTIASLLREGGMLVCAVPQERVRGDTTPGMILLNLLKGELENPHLHNLTLKDMALLFSGAGLRLKAHRYINLFPPYLAGKRKLTSYCLVAVGEKRGRLARPRRRPGERKP